MKKNILLLPLVLPLLLLFTRCSEEKTQLVAPVYDDALLHRTRSAANTIPGALPVSINYVKYAASIRKWKDVIDGGSDDDCVMARTAFQIEYADGSIMVDAGMDKAVHHFFEKDKPQPFDEAAATQVAQAVQQARIVVITHEHGDHVAGVVRNANNTVPLKTILTTEQADALINNPQMPEIRLDLQKSQDYIITDFQSVLPVAPGVALIKAPGHTPGEIMVYAKLQNGKEYIFTGDVSWCFKGVQETKQKPSSERKRVGEDSELVGKQLTWLNARLTKDNMVILVSHDDIMIPQYAAQGLIKSGLKIN
jgi:glyoxylase-like metal-dependent hydrolase (beta-lactamase superfamily II)